MAALKPYVVGVGSALFGSCENPLFQVSLLTECALEDAPKRFALVVTVTHVIADGHTFYALYKMLDQRSEPISLNATRAEDIDEKEEQLVGGFSAMGGCMAGMIGNIMFGSKRAIQVYEIDSSALASRKEALAQQGGVDYVSANDILTAAFFKATNDDVNLMAINLRNRVPGYADNMAGNYESLIWYAPSDVSPALIRKSLKPQPGFVRAGTPSSQYPSFLTRMKGRMNNCTNWATFYGDVTLPGCTQTMHLPIFGYDGAAACMNAAIIFRPTGDRLAVICVAHDAAQAALAASLEGVIGRL
eukprot:TRINITY_DN19012_c0_g1_i1.p1 TRINITY_DN19012_c0_g1~~TRINITY_DN19012_c0_g1_i1.p1  ORF type:complete len:302 (-),score=45.49 TRINITY_DN19012_c0_g1_i1:350-1255(-)